MIIIIIIGTSPPAADVMHKQSLWDRPGIQRDQTTVESGLVICEHQVSFRLLLPHTVMVTGFMPSHHFMRSPRLDDKPVRVAVGLRLGCNVCVCVSGTQFDACGTHAFVCKRAPGRITRHQALNDIVAGHLHPLGSQSLRSPSGWQGKMASDRTAWGGAVF